MGEYFGEWRSYRLLVGTSVDDTVKESEVKSRSIIGLLIMCVLAIAATAQENNAAQPQGGAIPSLPQQRFGSTVGSPTLQAPAGVQDAEPYPEQLESILTTMSAELAEIAQAVREGKISREQGEYVSLERYYVAMTRFQFLRAMYQDPKEPNHGESYLQPTLTPQVSTDAVSPPTLTCSPDLPQQLVGYLQLSPEQIQAIQVKASDQCKQIQPLVEQLEQSRRKEVSIKLSGKFDAQEAQVLAAEQSGIIKQILVANSQLETKLYSLLTTEQQRKVDGLLRQTLTSGGELPLSQ